MIATLLADSAPLLAGFTVLFVCSGLAALALLPRPRTAGAATGGWRAGLRTNRAPVAAVLAAVGLAVVVAALAAGLGDRHRMPAGLATRDFALVEREFIFRERLNERIVERLEQTHAQEMRQLREGYETELAALRSRYEEAYEQMTQNNEQLVRSIAVQYGLDPDFFARVSGVESGFDATVANPESGARGLFQFMPRTWNQIGEQFGDDVLAAGVSFEPVTRDNAGEAADPRNDARLNTIMGALLTRLNVETTRSTDPAIVYLAHFAGPEMANYVKNNLESNPDELIRDVVRRIMPNIAEAVIEQNAPAYEETTTLRDFYQYAAARFADVDTVLSENSDLAAVFAGSAEGGANGSGAADTASE
ncbi:MAG: transglycosylase SLT domain-containing protein [Alphaproteobacteria bacterium]|jgi:soluble lytic murein transglycosylase-like protein|nr:transglycosylase SLT domain-containing protein [Alphaproteobacteria bacterium]